MAEMNLEQRQYLTARFEEFVAVVHPSGDDQPVRKPYQWQIRLMLYVAGHGHWPQGIGAPTASGKTCVIDIHVFLNAMAGLVSAEERREPKACWRAAAAHSSSSGVDGEPPLAGR